MKDRTQEVFFSAPYVGSTGEVDTSIKEVEVATAFPCEQLDKLLVESSNYARLYKSMMLEGQRDPVELWGSFILHGRLRWCVAGELGIKCKVRQSTLKELSEAQELLMKAHPERVDKRGWAYRDWKEFREESLPANRARVESEVRAEREAARAEEMARRNQDDL